MLHRSNDPDNNPFRLSDRMLEDAGMTRIGDTVVAVRKNGKSPVVAKQSWLERLVESLTLPGRVRSAF